MKLFSFSLLLSMLLGLSACGGSRAVDHPEDYVPELQYFDMIDSYGVDTALTPRAELRLSPFEYGGLFEVFWQVYSLEDYSVTLKVGASPFIDNSIAVHSEVCGEGEWCDQLGSMVCEYTEDFYLSCDNANQLTDLVPLFSDAPMPQTLYLFLEVCDYDSFYCEYDYYPVLME